MARAAWPPLGAALALSLACAGGDGQGDDDGDPLDPDLIATLATQQGSGSGSDHAGSWWLAYSSEVCDCPVVEVGEQSFDICALVDLSGVPIEIQEGSGILGISVGEEGEFGLLTGAIESDGTFIVAGTHDGATILGPAQTYRRLNGAFSGDESASGWAGQRFIAEVGGQSIDCRSTGAFDLNRE